MVERPTDQDMKDLESRAEAVLAKRGGGGDVSPVAVEFAGSPKAGKSTTIEILNHFFKRMNFKVWAPTEGASKRTPYHLRRDLVAYNAWTLNYAISELLVAYHNVDRPHLVILDRGPFDSIAWMRFLKGKGELNDAEYRTIERFALHPKWFSLISRVYLFVCDPKVSLDRETQSKLTSRAGTAMNSKTLQAILKEYKGLAKDRQDARVFQVKTSESTTPVGTSFKIASDILDLLEGK